MYKVYIDGELTKWNVRQEEWGSSVYYLIYYGERLKGRFDSFEEINGYMREKLLEEAAEKFLKC